MAFADPPQTRWGCIVATIVVVPLALFVFLIGSMGGGGCEGMPHPCEGDYTPMYLMLGGLIVFGVTLSYFINIGLKKLRQRKRG